jgi:large subunit ribosomal protein L30
MPKAKTPKAKKAAGARIAITQVRSGIGHADTYRRTLRALGLRHHQQTVVLNDNPSIQGMIFKVRHLVKVAPAGEA